MNCIFNPCLSWGWVLGEERSFLQYIRSEAKSVYIVLSVCSHSSCICPSSEKLQEQLSAGELKLWPKWKGGNSQESVSPLFIIPLLWCQPTIKSSSSVWTDLKIFSLLLFIEDFVIARFGQAQQIFHHASYRYCTLSQGHSKWEEQILPSAEQVSNRKEQAGPFLQVALQAFP